MTDHEGPARWAVWLAWASVASVIPSVIWRTAVGLGVDLGWSQQHLDLEQIPGYGTLYVITLSVLSLLAASLTLGLVRPWGERLPRWFPIAGGRPVPVLMAVAASVVGASIVITICVMSIAHWDRGQRVRGPARLGVGPSDGCVLPTRAVVGAHAAGGDLGLLEASQDRTGHSPVKGDELLTLNCGPRPGRSKFLRPGRDQGVKGSACLWRARRK